MGGFVFASNAFQSGREAATDATAQASSEPAVPDDAIEIPQERIAQPAPAVAEPPAVGESAGWAPGQAPRGTPIPQHLVTDPNAGDYNQMRIEDPGFFCAAQSGSTINGVPVCD